MLDSYLQFRTMGNLQASQSIVLVKAASVEYHRWVAEAGRLEAHGQSASSWGDR